MSEKDKTCGTCLYGNYYKRHHNMKITAFVDCEVYSAMNEEIDDNVIAWMPLPEKKTITIPYGKWKELNEMADYQRTQKPESLYSGFVNRHPVYVSCCPKCGNELDDGDKVCHECGQRIDWSEDKEEK